MCPWGGVGGHRGGVTNTSAAMFTTLHTLPPCFSTRGVSCPFKLACSNDILVRLEFGSTVPLSLSRHQVVLELDSRSCLCWIVLQFRASAEFAWRRRELRQNQHQDLCIVSKGNIDFVTSFRREGEGSHSAHSTPCWQ